MSIPNQYKQFYTYRNKCFCYIFLLYRIRSLRNLVNHFCTAPKEIVIPKRIPRGPTDILQALEATVGRDPTAPHYKYHDDPYLIPMSNIGKRTFAMAQEAGKHEDKFLKWTITKIETSFII